MRNEIIHEMDINVSNDNSKTTGYRKTAKNLSYGSTQKTIIDLAQEPFLAYKEKCKECNVNVEKE